VFSQKRIKKEMAPINHRLRKIKEHTQYKLGLANGSSGQWGESSRILDGQMQAAATKITELCSEHEARNKSNRDDRQYNLKKNGPRDWNRTIAENKKNFPKVWENIEKCKP
jgi:hypothetical protein